MQQKHDLVARLEGDPDYHDPRVAGYWVWVACNSISSGGVCNTGGPWHNIDGKLVKGKSDEFGVQRVIPFVAFNKGIMAKHHGFDSRRAFLLDWFGALQKQLDRVRVCCGDWQRVCGHCTMDNLGLTGVFLDPPYVPTGTSHDKHVYGDKKVFNPLYVNKQVHKWCIEKQNNSKLRIILCGHEGDFDLPNWYQHKWKRQFTGNGKGKNRGKEVIWLSPHTPIPGGETQGQLI